MGQSRIGKNEKKTENIRGNRFKPKTKREKIKLKKWLTLEEGRAQKAQRGCLQILGIKPDQKP